MIRVAAMIAAWSFIVGFVWYVGPFLGRRAARRTTGEMATRIAGTRRDVPAEPDRPDTPGPVRCPTCPPAGCGVCHLTVFGFCPGCGLPERGGAWKHTDWCMVRRLGISHRLPDLFAVVGPLAPAPGILLRPDRVELTPERWAALVAALQDDTRGRRALILGDGVRVVPYLDHERPDVPDPLYRHRS